MEAVLQYASDDDACDAAFVGGPVAMAWSRFDETTRRRVRTRYLQAIRPWRVGQGYRMPGEFVVATARTPKVLPRVRRDQAKKRGRVKGSTWMRQVMGVSAWGLISADLSKGERAHCAKSGHTLFARKQTFGRCFE